jgi:hypothetical protein
MKHELTVTTTVEFTSHTIWPDDYDDMTLTEAMAYEQEIDPQEIVDYSDHMLVKNTIVKAIEFNDS